MPSLEIFLLGFIVWVASVAIRRFIYEMRDDWEK